MPVTQLDRDNPWPGLESFQEDARDYFHGREAEAQELLRRVAGAPLTVLFGKSGLGKTSLLKAGLFPRLREKHFLPVHVRLDIRPEAPALIDQLRDGLRAEIERGRVDAPPFAAGETLWEYLHRADLELWSEQNHPLTPVLVLDQFEEIFTLGDRLPEAVAQCKIDLGDLAENRIPAALAGRLAADASTAQRLDLRRMAYKLVVTLREDFLPHLEGWRAAVPSLGRVRVRLLPMRPEQALSAVYDAAPHLMDEPLARRIVGFVAAAQGDGTSQETSGRGEIEPALLSLFCRGLNERRKRQGSDRFDEQLLEGARQSIIADYYRSCVEGLPDSVSRFIETHLITEKGFRNSYAKDDAVPALLTQEQLDRLINRRLLRLEERYGTARIELTHDLLTRAVMAHRDRRRLEEEKATLARRVEEERQAMELEARTQQRRLLAMTLIALVCLAFAGIAVWQRQKASDAQRSSLSAKLASDALVERDRALDLSFLLGAAAWSVKPTAEARSVLLSNLLHQPALRGMLPSSFPAHTVAFSPDGRTLAAIDGANMIALWDAARHTRLGGPLAGLVASITFSPDGKTLASGGLDVILWDIGSREPRGQRLAGQGHQQRIRSVAFSPDGRILASGSDDATVILWDVDSMTRLGEPLAQHEYRVSSVAFSPDGKTLASGSEDDTVILWDVQSHQPLGEPLARHQGNVLSVAFSPNGQTLASGSADGTVILWNVESRTVLGEPFAPHEGAVQSIAFSPDGNLLASGSEDGTVIFWDVASGIRLGEPLGHKGAVWSVDFSPDGKTLAAGIEDKAVLLWDVAGRTALGEPLAAHNKGSVLSIGFSPDGKTLAAGTWDKTVVRWDVAGRRLLAPLEGHQDRVTGIAFSPDGTTLAAGNDKAILVWDVARRKRLCEPLDGHVDRVLSVSFSPDGRTVASGSEDGTVILWDIASCKPLGKPLAEHKDEIASVAFSPDGKTLASGSDDETVILWDVARRPPRGKPLAGRRGGSVLSVAFSPDGKILASGNADRAVLLWDIESRQPLGEPLAGHEGPVDSVSFSPDGKILASGDVAGMVLLWDVARRTRLGEKLAGHEDPVLSVSFSPDGKTLASGSRDGSVVLWDVDPDSWSRRACSIASRNLTCDEWRRYLLDEPYRKICPDLPDPERCAAQP